MSADNVTASTRSVTDHQAVAVLAGYFGLHFLIRALAPNSLELDEGAELLRTQELLLGYGTQPPLYTWLLYPLIQTFGPAVWPLALLKNLLLFGTHGYVYATARRLGVRPEAALVTTASLLLIPQIGWESQRDLTHSVLATHAAAGTLWIGLELLHRQTVRHYLALGVLFAAGMLAKYNFAVFAGALLLSALSLPRGRRVVFQPRLILPIAIVSFGLLPHALWLIDNWWIATTGTLHKMGVDDQTNPLRSITAVIAGLAQFLGLFVVIAGTCLYSPGVKHRRLVGVTNQAGALLTRLQLTNLALISIIALSLGMNEVKDRWLQPLFFTVPLWLSVYLDWSALPPRHYRCFQNILIVTACALLVGRAIDIHGSRFVRRPTRLGVSFVELIGGLPLPRNAVVLTDNDHLGGGLRLARPDLDVYVPNRRTRPPAGHCFLVWQPGSRRVMRHYHRWLQKTLVEPIDVLTPRGPAVSIPYQSGNGSFELYVAEARCQSRFDGATAARRGAHITNRYTGDYSASYPSLS